MDLLPHKLLTLLSSTLADQFTERQLRQHFEYLGDQFGTIEGSKREKSLAALRHWNSLTHGARERRFRALADIILNSPIPEQYRDTLTASHAEVRNALQSVDGAADSVAEPSMTDTSSPAGTKHIFISHAAKDAEFVGDLIDLLKVGIDGFVDSHVFCSSTDGLGIPAGQNFVEFIRSKIKSPVCVVFVMTETFVARRFCLCELGAAWALCHDIFPLLVPPLTYADMDGVLTGVQGEVYSKAGLNSLRDRVVAVLGLKGVVANRWERVRDKFLDKYPVASPKPVVGGKPSVVVTPTVAATPVRVPKAPVPARPTPSSMVLDEAIADAKKAMLALPQPVRDVLYHEHVGHTYRPDPFDDGLTRSLTDALQREYLRGEDENITSNGRNSKVSAAIAALQHLETVISLTPFDNEVDFADENGFPLSLSNRDFWEKSIGL
jgi:hypothetical protein